MINNESIGNNRFKVSSFCINGGQKQWIEIYSANRSMDVVGKLFIESNYSDEFVGK